MRNFLRRMMVSLSALLLVLVLLVAGVVLVRDGLAMWAIKKVIAPKLATQTGFGLEVRNVHVALMPPGVEIEGLRLTNPPDFPETRALDIRKLKISYDRSASTKEEARLPEVTFDLPTVVVVRKADGEMNFQRFAKQSKQEKPGGTQPRPPAPPAPPPAPGQKVERKVRIDHLNIRLGTVILRTYVAGQKDPEERKIVMNVDKQYTNVSNEMFKQIIAEISLEILFKSPDTLQSLGEGLLNSGKDAGSKAKDSAKQLQQQFKGLLNSLKPQQQPQ